MNSKVFLALRILLGVFVLVFGANKFVEFLPPFEHGDETAQSYFGSLVVSKTLVMVGVVEVLAGLAFILNKYGALMAVILMSISVNAVLFHATLDPANIGGAIALLVLNILVMIGYRKRYTELLKA